MLHYMDHIQILLTSNKVIVPRAIPIAKGAIIVPRRPPPWTVRPRQWHVIRGGHTV